jgi:hypothetical protein
MKPTIYEPVMRREQPILYLPSVGTTLTGGGIGPPWAGDGVAVVSHPAPAAGFVTEWQRTRFTSAASADNECGVHLPNKVVYRGNATSRGGFFFSALFSVFDIPDTTIRFFAGLSAGAAVCLSNVVPANSVGLWCDTTDAGNLTIVTTDNVGGVTKAALASAHTLTAGVLYEFVLRCNPNTGGNTLVTQLNNFGTDTVIASQTVGATMPLNTVFMAPQVGLSNAAHAAGGDVVLDLYNVYLRPNLRLVPLGRP